MVNLYLYNSISNQKELFTPIDPHRVGMYVCGPTVYARPHLGNAKSIVTYDLLFRVLREIYSDVIYVRNITDIDDKIIKAAFSQKKSVQDLTKQIIFEFNQDINALNVLAPTFEPKATDNLDEIIKLIQLLLEHEYAYQKDGYVLFRAKKFKEYGKLSGKNLAKNISGARIEVADYKENPEDFILWKPAAEEDKEILASYPSPFGAGRPGWHIECSAMSTKFLDKNFDIHGGGADLKFPHHENEIAQSCAAYPNSTYANYWVHNGFLTVNGEKMSKSLGNFITIADLLEKNVKAELIRFFLLSNHYRKPLDYNLNALNNLQSFLTKAHKVIIPNLAILKDAKLSTESFAYLLDDLNIAKFIANMHKDLKQAKTSEIALKNLFASLNFLGIFSKNYFETEKLDPLISEKILLLKKHRLAKEFKESDIIRDEIIALGYNIRFGQTGEIEVFKK